jgi:hypothetical protein
VSSNLTRPRSPAGGGDLQGHKQAWVLDGVVRPRERADDDAAWYAGSVRDPLIQRFTTESPAPDAGQVLAAIVRMRAHRQDVASRRVALRTGCRRDPERDGSQEVKGEA